MLTVSEFKFGGKYKVDISAIPITHISNTQVKVYKNRLPVIALSDTRLNRYTRYHFPLVQREARALLGTGSSN